MYPLGHIVQDTNSIGTTNGLPLDEDSSRRCIDHANERSVPFIIVNVSRIDGDVATARFVPIGSEWNCGWQDENNANNTSPSNIGVEKAVMFEKNETGKCRVPAFQKVEVGDRVWNVTRNICHS